MHVSALEWTTKDQNFGLGRHRSLSHQQSQLFLHMRACHSTAQQPFTPVGGEVWSSAFPVVLPWDCTVSGDDRGFAIVAAPYSAPLISNTSTIQLFYVVLSVCSPTACIYSINPHYPCIGVLGPSAPAPATAMSARNTTTGGGDRAGEELAGMEKRHRSCYRAKIPSACCMSRWADGVGRNVFVMFRIVAEWPQLGAAAKLGQ